MEIISMTKNTKVTKRKSNTDFLWKIVKAYPEAVCEYDIDGRKFKRCSK